MSEPVTQGMSVGCPYCPTRAQCACPDGPERCPDNADCPCDKTVCPCGKHATRPPADPPSDPTPPPPKPPVRPNRGIMIGFGLLLLILLGVAFGLRSCGDDDDSVAIGDTSATTVVNTDAAPPPDASTAVTDPPVTDAAPPPATDPPATDSPATDPPAPTTTVPATTVAPPPAFVPPVVGSDVIDDINAQVFGGQPTIGAGNCHPITPPMQQTDQTGGSPLVDPSLDVNGICLVNATVDLPPMLAGDYFFIAAIHDAPLTPETSIAYQPGIGLDRPGVDNAPVADRGEGLLQVPVDVLGFGGALDGWQQAEFLSVPGFGPSDLVGNYFAQNGSPYTVFAVPLGSVPAGTIAYWQSFGRQTAPGSAPTNEDPAASHLVIGGPVPPCIGTCGPILERFVAEAGGGGDTFTGVEGNPGQFWFFGPDNTELLAQLLDACAANDHFWVFYGSLTDVEFELTVTDTRSGSARVYDDPLGTQFQPITDTSAFATCP